MNTPAHLIFGAAAFGRPEQRWTMTAALLGALVPDLSLYVMVAWHLLVLRTEAQVVFDELYFSDTWQAVFAVDNSLILWGVVLGVAFWRRWPVAIAFAGGAVLHILFDFPLHAGDGRAHLWPLTMWVFDSPFSYWDSRFGARWISPLEVAICCVLVVLIWRRVQAWAWRLFFGALLLMEFGASNVWYFVF